MNSKSALEIYPTTRKEMIISVHDNDNDAYQEADQKQLAGYKILEIADVSKDVACMTSISNQGKILTKNAWVVVAVK